MLAWNVKVSEIGGPGCTLRNFLGYLHFWCIEGFNLQISKFACKEYINNLACFDVDPSDSYIEVFWLHGDFINL